MIHAANDTGILAPSHLLGIIRLLLVDTGTPLLFGLVLALLASLSADDDLLSEALTDESVLGLESLGNLEVVVDEAEAGALTSTELCLEAEDEDGGGVLHYNIKVR